MGWVMQELVYSLNYVLERMDLIRSWVDIEVEKVSICVIFAVRTESVGHFLWNCPVYSECRCHGKMGTPHFGDLGPHIHMILGPRVPNIIWIWGPGIPRII